MLMAMSRNSSHSIVHAGVANEAAKRQLMSSILP
jgi:hypothetical protein